MHGVRPHAVVKPQHDEAGGGFTSSTRLPASTPRLEVLTRIASTLIWLPHSGDGRPHAGATSGEATSRYILAASLSAHAGGELSRSLLGSFCEGQQRGRRRVRAPAYLVRTGKCSTQPNARSLLLVLLAATPQKSPCRPIEDRHGPRPVCPLTSLTSHTQANHPVRGGQQLKLLGGPGANLKTVHLEPFSIRLGLFWRLDVLVQQPAHLRGRPALQFYGVLQPLQRLPQPPRWQGRGGRDARAVAQLLRLYHGLGRCLHHQPLFKSQPHIIRWWRPTV